MQPCKIVWKTAQFMKNPLTLVMSYLDRKRILRSERFATEEQVRHILGYYGIGIEELEIPSLNLEGRDPEVTHRFINLTMVYFQKYGRLMVQISGKHYALPPEEFGRPQINSTQTRTIKTPFSIEKIVSGM